MIKKQINRVKLRIPAAKASPSPPVGPMLGQAGLNIMEFCKEFNNKTQNIKDGVIVPVSINVFDDKSFIYSIKSPSVSFMLKTVVNSDPNISQSFKIVSLKQIYEIASIKLKDENCSHINLKSMCSSIVGTAKSIGITVVKK